LLNYAGRQALLLALNIIF